MMIINMCPSLNLEQTTETMLGFLLSCPASLNKEMLSELRPEKLNLRQTV